MHRDHALRRAALVLLLSMAPGLAAAQGRQARMVVANGLACRAEPTVDAPLVRRASVGDVIPAGGQTNDGETDWYRDPSYGCWIYGPLTVEYDRRDPEPALIAAADHILAREDDPLFIEWVAVENVLLDDQAPYYRTPPAALSPLRQLRRLQVVEGALRTRGASRYAVERDPMKRAWIIAHADMIRGFEPSGGWVMEAETYWRLYDQHRDSDAADEIAWVAAQGHVPADECYTSCILDIITRTYGRYWRERPAGAHIAEALARGTQQAEVAARYVCEKDFDDPARTRTLARDLIESLRPVRAAGQSALVAHLEAVEAGCV